MILVFFIGLAWTKSVSLYVEIHGFVSNAKSWMPIGLRFHDLLMSHDQNKDLKFWNLVTLIRLFLSNWWRRLWPWNWNWMDVEVVILWKYGDLHLHFFTKIQVDNSSFYAVKCCVCINHIVLVQCCLSKFEDCLPFV